VEGVLICIYNTVTGYRVTGYDAVRGYRVTGYILGYFRKFAV